MVTGGTVRPLQHSLVNPLATVLLGRLHASIALHRLQRRRRRAAAITNINLPEAEIKRAMLLAARRRVIVADGSKLGEVELAKVCDLDEVQHGGHRPDRRSRGRGEIEGAGCEVELAR